MRFLCHHAEPIAAMTRADCRLVAQSGTAYVAMEEAAMTCTTTCEYANSEAVAATHATGEKGSIANGKTHSQYQGFTTGDSSSMAIKTPTSGGNGRGGGMAVVV